MVSIRPVLLFGIFVKSSTIANAFTALHAVTFNRHAPQKQQRQQQQLYATTMGETKYPMLVVGTESAALGASMALCAREILLQPQQQRSEIPPAQLVAFCNSASSDDSSPSSSLSLSLSSNETSITSNKTSTAGGDLQTALLLGQYQTKPNNIGGGPSVTEYQQMFTDINGFFSSIYDNENDYGKPILHTIIGTHSHGSLSPVVLLDPTVRNSVFFSGYDFYAPLSSDGSFGGSAKLMLERESAVQAGKMLERLLMDGDTKPFAAVTMDYPTHLSLLQSNTLPKTRGILGEYTDNDYWVLRDTIFNGLRIDDNGDGVLLEYSYDYANPFGGSDPLACPSMGYVLPSPLPPDTQRSSSSNSLQPANEALAAAYTAMKGYGMDPVAALCIANSVRAVFLDDPQVSYSWDTIDKIVSYSQTVRQGIQQEDGLPRKRYREFGYK